jgi:predicted short-subunit dehydrogenase-like oxidoreductase (DUF2520 family)
LSGWAERLAAELGSEVVTPPYETLGEVARLILITTPDRQLASAAAGIGKGALLHPGTLLVQTSATEPASVLSSAASGVEGITCLSLHPLKPFPDRERDIEHFKGIIMGIEGEGEAPLLGHALAEMLGCHPLDITRDDKALYHAAGVLAFTGVMALARAAGKIGTGLDLDPSFLRQGILPGISAAAEAVGELGLPEGLTGPISRGDSEVVSRQIKILLEKHPDLVPLYREIGLIHLRMLEEEGGLGIEVIEQMKKALSP